MKSSPHPRLAEVFALAVQAPPQARAELLDRECAGNPVLRQELESLLANDVSHAVMGGPLHPVDGPPLVPAAALAAALVHSPAPADQEASDYVPGTVVDQYTIGRVVGRGGFGIVYFAEQALPERRTVALKILEQVALSPRLARRFEEERRALANLNHPGIAKIYSGGTTAAGHPYFAMEFVAAAGGQEPAPSITDYADRHALSLRKRVELFLLVCHAVQHAHQQGVIHRDLKPSNIRVEHGGGSPQPKVIDFGLARHFEEGPGAGPLNPRTVLTLSREILGTPAYMSPEQAAGEQADTRSDVYSLGVVLYELLCGCLPIATEQSGLLDRLRAVREQEPLRPPTAVRRSRSAASTSRAATQPLSSQLRGDLETILLRVLEKDPSRRFATVAALADDLTRHLTNQPIESRPRTLAYTLTKFVRRHRAFAAAVAIVFVALAMTTVSSLYMLHVASSVRTEAQAMAAIANLRLAQYALENDEGDVLRQSLDAVPPTLRNWEWGDLDARGDVSLHTLVVSAERVAALAVDATGTGLLCGDRDGVVSTWNPANRSQLVPTVVHTGRSGQRDVWSVAWSPDGNHFATGSFDGSARLCRADGSLVKELDAYDGIPYQTVYAVAFSPDGRWLVVGAGRGGGNTKTMLAVHDATTGADLWRDPRPWHTQPVMGLAFTREGKWLASGSDDATVQIWQVDGASPVHTKTLKANDAVNAIAFSPDGRLLAAGTQAHEIELYEWASDRPALRWTAHRQPLASLAFHPEGHLLVSASWDTMIGVWKVVDGSQVDTLRGHRGRVNRVAFDPDGRLFSASNDGTVREWRVPCESAVRRLKIGKRPVTAARFLADGTLAVLSSDGGLRTIDARTAEVRTVLDRDHRGTFEVSSDGTTVGWFRRDGLCTWQKETGAIPHPHPALQGRRFIGAIDARQVLVAGADGLMRLDLQNREWTLLEPLPRFQWPDCHLHKAWQEPSTHRWWTLWNDGPATWIAMGGHLITPLAEHSSVQNFSSGGLVVLAQVAHGRLDVFDSAVGKIVVEELVGHGEEVSNFAFSPNQSRLATVGGEGTLRLWDWRRKLQVLSLSHPATQPAGKGENGHRLLTVSWSLDGATLVTGSTDGTVHLWPSRRPERR